MILDGRDKFYQWDLDRKLIVTDESIDEVHFCNRTDDCSLICEVYSDGELRLVNVPNVLLTKDWRINVYAFDGNYTKHCVQYEVVSRTKPSDYVYTETEIKNYDELLERVKRLEEGGISDDTVAAAVKEYLDENGVDVDLEGYATEEFVNEKIETIELTPGPQGPAGPAGKDGYTPVKGVDYFDGKDGAAGKDGKDGQDYVLTEADKQEIAGMVEVTGESVDLTDYYTKTETDAKIDEKIAAIEIPEGGSSDSPMIAGSAEGSALVPGQYGAGVAGGKYSVSLGGGNAWGVGSLALGNFATTSAQDAVAILGSASKYGSVAIGSGTTADNSMQVAIGRYNVSDTKANFVVGNAWEKSGSEIVPQNAMVTYGENNEAYFPGKVTVGADREEVATKAYVDAHAGSGGGGEGGSAVEEIYVGTTAPDDANIKIWVDTDEESNYPSREDIVENIIPETFYMMHNSGAVNGWGKTGVSNTRIVKAASRTDIVDAYTALDDVIVQVDSWKMALSKMMAGYIIYDPYSWLDRIQFSQEDLAAIGVTTFKFVQTPTWIENDYFDANFGRYDRYYWLDGDTMYSMLASNKSWIPQLFNKFIYDFSSCGLQSNNIPAAIEELAGREAEVAIDNKTIVSDSSGAIKTALPYLSYQNRNSRSLYAKSVNETFTQGGTSGGYTMYYASNFGHLPDTAMTAVQELGHNCIVYMVIDGVASYSEAEYSPLYGSVMGVADARFHSIDGAGGLTVRGNAGNITAFEIFSEIPMVEDPTKINAKDVVLLAPNGTKYKLTVSNDGTLSATAI